MNQGIFFSIITPCYNSSNYIHETYSSLLSQTNSSWEWLVVDDCSSDNSFEILQSIAREDFRVKIFKTQGNSGAAVARNLAMENASGKYFAFLDIDDLWNQKKLELYFDKLKDEKISFGYSNYIKIGPHGEMGTTTILTPKTVSYTDLLKTCSICTSTAVIHREAVGSIRMKPELRRGQDYIFWLDILRTPFTATCLNSEALTLYRVGNSTSLSNNKLKKAIGQWNMYRNYLKLNIFEASYYFACYAVMGYMKHKKF